MPLSHTLGTGAMLRFTLRALYHNYQFRKKDGEDLRGVRGRLWREVWGP